MKSRREVMLASSTAVLALMSTKIADAQTRIVPTPSEDAAKSASESVAPASQASTQSASAPSPGPATTEIVVTAQKRSERINDVPISITAATGAQLEKLGITDPVGLKKIVAGFTFQQSGA